jgi:RND family efflux transporter MFP subunit
MLTTAGILRARNRASLGFQVPGRVVEMPVEMGDSVGAGAVLAALDPRAFELRVKQAEADLLTARASLAERQRRFDSEKRLLPKGATSRAEYEQVEAGVAAASSQVEVAEAAVRLARRDLENTVLHAPCAGRVAQRHVQNFTDVAAGAPVFEFDGAGDLEVLAHVPEVFARTLDAGGRALVTLQGGEGRTLAACIAQISSRSEAGWSVAVILRLDETADDLRSGLVVEVAFQRSGRSGMAVVPAIALLAGPQTNAAAVFVLDARSQTVSRRQVTLGEPLREGLEVTSGLRAGEMIVVAGVPFLRDGQKVRTFDSACTASEARPLALTGH